MSSNANATLKPQTHFISGTQVPLPTILTPVMTHGTGVLPSPKEPTTNPVDDFFGYTLSRSQAHNSRPNRPLSDASLPAYSELPPVYTQYAEPVTLAMYLFKFGFLFPPFWVMGALILVSPLRAPAPSPSLSWLPEKTESERQEIVKRMRQVEVKWAWRCLWALIVLLIVGIAIGLAVWAVRSRT